MRRKFQDSSEDQQLLNEAVRIVEKWCDKWKMKINENTVLLRVTNKLNHIFDFNYSVNSSVLSTVDVLKYLGMNISSNLCWSYHVKKVCETAEKKLWFLRVGKTNSLFNLRASHTRVCLRNLGPLSVRINPETGKSSTSSSKIYYIAILSCRLSPKCLVY